MVTLIIWGRSLV